MLTCIYHPLDGMRVVEQDEAERLKSSGVWFDSPAKAKDYKAKVENDVKKESKPRRAKASSNVATEENLNER